MSMARCLGELVSLRTDHVAVCMVLHEGGSKTHDIKRSMNWPKEASERGLTAAKPQAFMFRQSIISKR